MTLAPSVMERRQMSYLLSYGLIALGWMLGGLVLLEIFSLLAMAHQGDECLDQLEFILSQRQAALPPSVKEGNPHHTRIPTAIPI
jgi:hypothetical protein